MHAAIPVLLLAGCVRATPSLPPAEDPALMVALFLDARSIEPRLADDFACVGIENAGLEEDPPEAVQGMLRERLGAPIIPQSGCRREATSLVVAQGAGGEGTWLTIGDIACEGGDRCTATISYYVANQGAGARDVIAEQTQNGWRIRATGRSWIS